MKDFRVIEAGGRYINTTTDSDFIERLSEITGLPLRNYFLSETQVRSILNYKL
jgi:hypothetical protein